MIRLTLQSSVHVVATLRHDRVDHASWWGWVSLHPSPAGKGVERVARVFLRVDAGQDLATQVGTLGGHAHLFGSNDRHWLLLAILVDNLKWRKERQLKDSLCSVQ